MENAKEPCGESKANDSENPNSVTEPETESNLAPSRQSSRTPFTSLSQVDADLALARRLQEQERAYMMLALNGAVSDYGSSETGSLVYEDYIDDPNDDDNDDDDADADEDAFDIHAHLEATDNNQVSGLQRSAFNSDEAYARALLDAEEREMAAHLMALAGINDWGAEDTDDHDSNSQDAWEVDDLSYEELLALGEVVGTESRGLSADTIASLPSVNYKTESNQDGSTDQCVICRLDYEDGDTLTVLSCKHSYHCECINNWLQINKVCPVCNAEVSSSENR